MRQARDLNNKIIIAVIPRDFQRQHNKEFWLTKALLLWLHPSDTNGRALYFDLGQEPVLWILHCSCKVDYSANKFKRDRRNLAGIHSTKIPTDLQKPKPVF